MSILPSEKPASYQWLQGVKILIYSFLIILLVNGLAFLYLQHFNPNKAYALIRYKWDLLKNNSQKVDWLILGDSSGNQGLDPDLFQKKLQQRALNICTIGDMLILDDLWQLQYSIAQGHIPDQVLLIHTYDIWHRSSIPTGYGSQIPVNLSDESIFSLRYNALPEWKKKLMNAFPLNYQRASLGHVLQHPSKWFQTKYQWTTSGFESIENADTNKVLTDTKTHLAFVQQHRLELSEVNRLALSEIAKLAEAYQIKVYLANAPFYEGLIQHKDFQNYFAALQSYLSSFCERHNWTYLNNPPQGFKKDEMENADHLTVEAARRFTNKLITEIAK